MGASSSAVGGPIQVEWFRDVNEVARATPWLHAPAQVFAEYGVVLFAALLACSWWFARRDGEARLVARALWAPMGVLVAVGVNQLLVAAVAEPRPYILVPDALVLVSRSTDPSFPSDHAVMAGAVAAGVLMVHRRLGFVALVLAVAMAAARVYVGAHFPADVAAGLVVGAALAVASYGLVRPVMVRATTALAGTFVRPLLMARTSGPGR